MKSLILRSRSLVATVGVATLLLIPAMGVGIGASTAEMFSQPTITRGESFDCSGNCSSNCTNSGCSCPTSETCEGVTW